MGAHSSLNITREKALELWREMKDIEPSDYELERWLDNYLDDKLYNISICNEEDISEYSDGSWLSVDYLMGY